MLAFLKILLTLAAALALGLAVTVYALSGASPFDRRCVYSVGPRVPAARYWTLGLIDKRGFPVANRAERYVFRSSEILRSGGGGFAIAVAAEVQPGNWLPIGAPGRFGLALRLYDSPLGATAGEIEPSAAPQITRIGCG